ncbi:ankyrin repeat domain-containing protein [Flavobacterium sp. ZB4P13]|uniref:ankyrin repeat domain-containing protein n=1 Tax=Flavobacterium sp. ZB4P13 TaxID=3401728 RepID=UPI003AAF6F48
MKENNLNNVDELLKQNANPNFTEENSWMKVNLLITAVNNDNYEIAKKLIENKANVNWKDGFNTDALLYACSKGNIKIVNLLLENGADINSKDNQGNSVLSAAKESNNKELVALIENKLKLKPEKKNSKLNDLIEKADKLCIENKNYKKANELYTSAINYNENLVEIYTKRAGTFYAMQDFENAIKDFTKVLELNPKDISTIYFMRGLSKTLLKKEDKEGGCSDIKKAIDLGYNTSDLNGLDEYCNFKK